MTVDLYRVCHIAGLIALFFAWGGLILLPQTHTAIPGRRALMITHGLGLLLLFVAGFGMLARLGIHWPWPAWVWAKMGIWLLLGGGVVIAKRRHDLAPLLWWLVPALGVSAAYLALIKPF